MADKTTGELQAVNVGDLSAAPDIYDDFKMPGELQGGAVHVTGSQMKQYAVAAGFEAARQFAESVESDADAANAAAANASRDATVAASSAQIAMGAKTAAQTALSGVQNAIKNIPAGSTLIINDLTTGGTKSALSAEMGKVLGRRPNPNFVDNPDFTNAVNQMEFTTGSSNSALGYTFDRWRRYGYTTGTITLSSDGVLIDSSATASGSNQLYQIFEKSLPVGTYTLSVMVAELSGRGVLTIADATGNPLVSNYIDEPGVVSVTGTNISPGSVYFGAFAGGIIKVTAIKLECGNVQTLAQVSSSGVWFADKVADYAVELAKCQRHLMVYPMINTAMMWSGVAWSSDQVILCVPLPQPLRASPAQITNASDFKLHDGVSSTTVTAIAVYSKSANSITLRVYSSGLTLGKVYTLRAAAKTKLIFNASI